MTTRTLSSYNSYRANLLSAACNVRKAPVQEYYNAQKPVELKVPEDLEGYIDLIPSNRRDGKKPLAVQTLRRIESPIIQEVPELFDSLRVGKLSKCLRRSYNWEISALIERFGASVRSAVPYDAGAILRLCAQRLLPNDLSSALASLARDVANIEIASEAENIGLEPVLCTEGPSTCYWLLEKVEELNKLMSSIRNRKEAGYSIKDGTWIDNFGRMSLTITLASQEVTIYKGTLCGAVMIGDELMVAKSSIADHAFTSILTSQNWLLGESCLKGKTYDFMCEFRRDVLCSKEYDYTVKVATALEGFGNALIDATDECGMTYLTGALSDMASACGTSLFGLTNMLNNRCSKHRASGWLSLLSEMTPTEVGRVCQLGRTGIYAIVDIEKTIEKQVDRTTRRIDADDASMDRLCGFTIRHMCWVHVVKNRNPCLPELVSFSDRGELAKDRLLMKFSELGPTRFFRTMMDPTLWVDVGAKDLVRMPKDLPMVDLLRSKKVHNPEISFGKSSKSDEIQRYIQSEESDVAPDPSSMFKDLKRRHKRRKGKLEFWNTWDWNDFSDESKEIIESAGEFIAGWTVKQRELKVAGRTFGTGTFYVKKRLAVVTKMLHGVLEYLPGSVMADSEESRRTKIEDMGLSTSSDHQPRRAKILIDISSHNQSFWYNNTHKFFRLIGVAGGMPDFEYAMELFRTTVWHIPHPSYDAHYLCTGAPGGMEGWLGDAWGGHTGANSALYAYDQGLQADVGTYGDDVLIDGDLKQTISFTAIEASVVQHFVTVGGQETKPEQLAVTRSRATLTRTTYAQGAKCPGDLKRLMSVMAVNDSYLVSSQGRADTISSSTSAVVSSSDHPMLGVVQKWMLATPMIVGDLSHVWSSGDGKDCPDRLAPLVKGWSRAQAGPKKLVNALTNNGVFGSNGVLYKLRRRGTNLMPRVEEYGPKRSQLGPLMRDLSSYITTSGLKVIICRSLKPEFFFTLGLLPQSLGGLGLSSWLNDGVAGMSNVNAEVLNLLASKGEDWLMRRAYNLVHEKGISRSGLVMNRYLTTGTCFGHLDVLNNALRLRLEELCTNPNVLTYIRMSEDRTNVIDAILHYLQPAFSQRIAQKYLDVSDVNILDSIIGKIENMSVIMSLLDYPRWLTSKMSNLGPSNLKKLIGSSPTVVPSDSKADSDFRRSKAFGTFNFVDPHEPSIIGALVKVPFSRQIRVSKVKSCMETGATHPSFRRQEVRPKYVKSGVLDLLVPGLVTRLVVENARFTVWVEHDQQTKDSNVTQLADYVLSRMTKLRMRNLREFIPPPTGGELFHRMDNSGFVSGVSLRKLSNHTGSVSVTYMEGFFSVVMGVNSNVNLGLISAYVTSALLASMRDKGREHPIVFYELSDSCLQLVENVERMSLCTSRIEDELPKSKGLFMTTTIITEEAKLYWSWLGSCRTYKDYARGSTVSPIREPGKASLEESCCFVYQCLRIDMGMDPQLAPRSMVEELIGMYNIPYALNMIMLGIRSASIKRITQFDGTHQSLRNELAAELMDDLVPLMKFPQSFDVRLSRIIVSQVIRYGLVLVRPPEIATTDMLVVDWDLTKVKSLSVARVMAGNRKLDDPGNELGWLRDDKVVQVVEELRDSNVIDDRLVVKVMRGSTGKPLGALRRVDDDPIEDIVNVSGSFMKMAGYGDLNVLERSSTSIRLVAEAFGQPVRPRDVLFAALSKLNGLSDTFHSVFDATAGRGEVGYACDRLDISCASYTRPEHWLRGGVKSTVEVSERYNYLDMATWPEAAFRKTVHVIDTNTLELGDGQPANIKFPADTACILFRYNSNVFSKLTMSCPELKSEFPNVYLFRSRPGSRYMYVLLSRVRYNAVECKVNAELLSLFTSIRSQPTVCDYPISGRLTTDEMDAVAESYLVRHQKGPSVEPSRPKDIYATTLALEKLKPDNMDMNLYMLAVKKICKGEDEDTGMCDWSNVEDTDKRLMDIARDNKLYGTRQGLFKSLLERGIDLTARDERLKVEEQSMTEEALMWIISCYKSGLDLQPGAYLTARAHWKSRNQHHKLKLVGLIRQWQGSMRKAKENLGLSWRQLSAVWKRPLEDSDYEHAFLDIRSVGTGPTTRSEEFSVSEIDLIFKAIVSVVKPPNSMRQGPMEAITEQPSVIPGHSVQTYARDNDALGLASMAEDEDIEFMDSMAETIAGEYESEIDDDLLRTLL